jgi:LacI family transcriptional regulator
MVTIRDVAAQAGVSATTVSHVVNETRPVSPAVRDRVLAAMVQLGYQPNALARSLRRKQTHTLGMIVPDSANPFFAEVARGIEDASFQLGYSAILCNSEGDPARERFYLDLLSKKQVDGIVLVAAGETSGQDLPPHVREIPMVVIDRAVVGLQVDCILADNAGGGRLATRHLVELGHRRIGCVAGPDGLTPSTERLQGYRRALQEASLPADEALVVRGDFHDQGGFDGALRLLELPHPPTAIFACNDLMAIGAVAAALRAGRSVPSTLSVVGFDDIHLSAFLNPPLTTVAQPKFRLGELACRLLSERLADRSLAPRHQLLGVQLVLRQTTAPPPAVT